MTAGRSVANSDLELSLMRDGYALLPRTFDRHACESLREDYANSALFRSRVGGLAASKPL